MVLSTIDGHISCLFGSYHAGRVEHYICQDVGLFGIEKHVKGVTYTDLKVLYCLPFTTYSRKFRLGYKW